MAFYSPCQCGKFDPRVTSNGYEARKRRLNGSKIEYYWAPIREVTICRNCGRHEPKREKPCN